MKFIHCADIHLDSPLRGLENYEGAPVEAIRGATRKAFENLIGRCLGEGVDFLLICGDLFDGEWRDFNTGLHFRAQMARLREAGIAVYVIRGNHDAASRFSKNLSLPENVHSFPSDRPATFIDAERGVAFHGQSFATPAVSDNLAAAYPEPRPGFFNVGLLHTSVNGRPGHAPYAPCGLADLSAKGYDYWALGHVHKREILSETPWIVFPGNLQGRHIRETGAKGFTLVEVRDGEVESVRHCSVDVVRWAEIVVNTAGAESIFEIASRSREAVARAVADAEGRLLAARLAVEGRCPAHNAIAAGPAHLQAEVRGAAADVGVDAVWIANVRIATAPMVDLEAVRARDDALGELLRLIRALGAEEAEREALGREFDDFIGRLPAEIRDQAGTLVPRSPEAWEALLEEIEGTLVPRLLDADGN